MLSLCTIGPYLLRLLDAPFETLYRVSPLTPIDIVPLFTNYKVSFKAKV